MRTMKKIGIITMCTFICSCGANQEQLQQIENLSKERDAARDSITLLTKKVKELEENVSILKFPADQRFAEIIRLLNDNSFDKAKKEINVLKTLFPKSDEASKCDDVLSKIEQMELKAKEEEERFKALGFKAIKQQTSFQIDYNHITLSDIKIGKTYTHDNYGSQYRYHEADRGSKYVLVTMTVKSDINDPELPELQVYKIEGGKMIRESFFYTNFARWDDYGSYLGNDHDFGNDFAKTSTVKFKLASEVEDDVLKGPYAIVCKKENGLIRKYDRFEEPSVRYTGSVKYESILTQDSFKEDYILVKTFNL